MWSTQESSSIRLRSSHDDYVSSETGRTIGLSRLKGWFGMNTVSRLALVAALSVILLALPVFAQSDSSDGPLTIVDSAGRTVQIPEHIDRVVVVNPPAAEILAILGVSDCVVGVIGSTTSKPELSVYAGLPLVSMSPFSPPDPEVVLELEPQLMITYGTHPFANLEQLADSLEPAGVVVVGLDVYKLDTLFDDIEKLGLIFDRVEKAQELSTFLRSAMDEVSSLVSESGADAPRVFAENHGGMAFGPGTEWDTLITRAGGINVFSDSMAPYADADPEVILERDPDVLLFDNSRGGSLGYGVTDEEPMAALLAQLTERPGWNALSALENGRAYIISASIASGPRKIFMVPFLAKIFYPELDIDAEALLREYHESYLGVDHWGTFVYPAP